MVRKASLGHQTPNSVSSCLIFPLAVFYWVLNGVEMGVRHRRSSLWR